VAAGLAAQGVETGARVAVLARNSHAFAAVRFALARLGAVLVPINFMLNAEEVRFILDHSGAQLLCVDSGLTELGREASKGTAIGKLLWLPSEDESSPAPGLLKFDDLLWHGDIAPARELSTLVGAWFGSRLLREDSGPWRIMGAALIVAGVISLAIPA
jgi:fatty-acyl-CoA synthase